MNKSLSIIWVILAAPSLVFADRCKYEKPIDFTIDSRAVEELRLQVGAGSLDVYGDSSVDTITVSATACANSRDQLEQMDITQRVRNGYIELRTQIPDVRGSWFWNWGNYSATIDIEITLPASMALDVEDSSGAIYIDGVSELNLTDSSGGIWVSNVLGDVTIEDSSGSMDISSIGGNVRIEDGSGDITVSGVDASVIIEDDGSGSIWIEQVGADVEVRDDGYSGW